MYNKSLFMCVVLLLISLPGLLLGGEIPLSINDQGGNPVWDKEFVTYVKGDSLKITVNTDYDCVMTQKDKDSAILYTIDPLAPGTDTYPIMDSAAVQCVSRKSSQGFAPMEEACTTMVQRLGVPSLNTYGVMGLILLLAGAAVWQFKRMKKANLIRS